MPNRKRNNWRTPDPAKRVDLRKLPLTPNPIFVEAMRQEQDRRRLRRLFGVNPIAR